MLPVGVEGWVGFRNGVWGIMCPPMRAIARLLGTLTAVITTATTTTSMVLLPPHQHRHHHHHHHRLRMESVLDSFSVDEAIATLTVKVAPVVVVIVVAIVGIGCVRVVH